MSFVLTRDPTDFHHRAWRLLSSHPRYNTLATVLIGAIDGLYADRGAVFGYVPDAGGTATAAAIRTPPYPLLTTLLAPAAADELMSSWLGEDPNLTGANGEPETVRALAAAWRERTGGATRLTRAMAMHRLQEVVSPPRPPRGRLRLGQPADRDLMIRWWDAFAREADAIGGDHAVAMVDQRLRAERLFVWDDRGPVSLVAASVPVAGVVRIGPVYTPPERRRRGFAGMAVAEVSRRLLAREAHTCMLFTDLANPTSNKIYAEVGYRRFGDWEEHAFCPTGSA